MKIINFLLAAMFLAFTYVQFNDPDPAIWITIYGVMAVTCILAAFNYYSRRFLIALMVVYAVYSFTYIPGVLEWLSHDNKSDLFDDVAKMEHLYIEESREFLGLLICIGVLAFYIFRSSRKRA